MTKQFEQKCCELVSTCNDALGEDGAENYTAVAESLISVLEDDECTDEFRDLLLMRTMVRTMERVSERYLWPYSIDVE